MSLRLNFYVFMSTPMCNKTKKEVIYFLTEKRRKQSQHTPTLRRV